MYGILNEEMVYVKFKSADTLKKLANMRLSYKMKSEGFSLNTKGVIDYIDSWLEWSQESEEPVTERKDILDQIASTLVYSNVHLMNCKTRSEISNQETDEVYKWTVRILDHHLDKFNCSK